MMRKVFPILFLLLVPMAGATETVHQQTTGANSPIITNAEGDVVISNHDAVSGEHSVVSAADAATNDVVLPMPPEPLTAQGKAEQTHLVRTVRDAQVAELRGQIALLEAKLAAVERLLTGQASEAATAAIARYERWHAAKAGDSGCVLSIEGEWMCQERKADSRK